MAAERRRKAKANRDKRSKPNATQLALLGWAIFVPNVESEVMSAQTVAKVYGLRWRIETIVKAWKSHFRITRVPKGSESQLLAIFYARLIFITVMAQLCKDSWPDPWRRESQPPGSVRKIAGRIGDFFLGLCLQAWQPRLEEALLLQLDYHGRDERRTRQNFLGILMKLA